MAVWRGFGTNSGDDSSSKRDSLCSWIWRRGSDCPVGNAGYASADSVCPVLSQTPQFQRQTSGFVCLRQSDFWKTGHENIPRPCTGFWGNGKRRQYACRIQCSKWKSSSYVFGGENSLSCHTGYYWILYGGDFFCGRS